MAHLRGITRRCTFVISICIIQKIWGIWLMSPGKLSTSSWWPCWWPQSSPITCYWGIRWWRTTTAKICIPCSLCQKGFLHMTNSLVREKSSILTHPLIYCYCSVVTCSSSNIQKAHCFWPETRRQWQNDQPNPRKWKYIDVQNPYFSFCKCISLLRHNMLKCNRFCLPTLALHLLIYELNQTQHTQTQTKSGIKNPPYPLDLPEIITMSRHSWASHPSINSRNQWDVISISQGSFGSSTFYSTTIERIIKQMTTISVHF